MLFRSILRLLRSVSWPEVLALLPSCLCRLTPRVGLRSVGERRHCTARFVAMLTSRSNEQEEDERTSEGDVGC